MDLLLLVVEKGDETVKKMKWHYLSSGPCRASFNMALDEALLEWNSKGEIGPVLRFYQWENPTLSIGYFQKIKEEIDLQQVEQLGLSIVRRPTGGRGVLHEHELTYSVIVSEDYPEMPETVTEAYRVISGGVLEGFRNLGLQAEFSVPERQQKATSPTEKSAVCFDTPSWYELVVEGKKVAGSAQTRQKGVILQHGAILLSLEIEKLISLFHFSSERAKERMRKSLPERAVAIDQLTSEKISVEACIAAFKQGFEDALGIELIPYELTKEQLAEVEAIEKEKYANEAWTFKK